MRKQVYLFGAILLGVCALMSGCGRSTPREAHPFTFDYKLDQTNAKFFLDNDDIGMILASSPFYTGAQPLPFRNADEYYQVRRKKVDEIIAETDKLVKAAEKSKPGMEKMRKAFLDYLTVLRENDPKAEEFIRVSLNSIILLESKEALAEATYKSYDTSSENEFAKSYMQYLKVVKGCEIGMLYLQDADNIVCGAAGALLAEGETKNAKISAANKKLDSEMKAFDSIKGDLADVVTSFGKVSYGFRQISTADYYFARAAVKFMRDEIPGLKTKMAGVKPNKVLSAQDIAFINSYLGSFGKLSADMQAYLDSVDRSKLVDVSQVPNSIFPTAYADGEPNDYVNAYKAAATPTKEPEGWSLRGALSKGWSATKTLVHGVQSGVGATIDIAGLAVRNPTRAVMGWYYGNTWKETWDDMKANAQEVKDNWRDSRSGSATLRTAYEGFKAAEKGTEEFVQSTVGKATGDGWTNWLAGKAAGLTVGIFTGLGKGISLIGNRQATTSDYVVGTLEIACSATGGSKLVLRGTQVPGLLKGLKEGIWVGGKKLMNFVGRAVTRGERSQLQGLLKEAMERGINVGPQVAALTQRIAAEQAILTSLRLTGKQLTSQLRSIIAGGIKAGTQNTLSTWRKSLYEFTRQQFKLNLQGINNALASAMGNTAGEYLDNLVGQQVEDILKEMVDEALRGCPEPEEMGGKWTGITTFTVVNMPSPDKAKQEGCDLDFSELLKELKGKPLPTSIKLDGNGGALITLTIKGSSSDPLRTSYTYNRSTGDITMQTAQKGAAISFKGKAIRADDHYEMKGTARITFGGTAHQVAYMGGNFKVTKK